VKVGFGVASITPKPPVWLAGFGDRSEPAQEVKEELEARALYLNDGDNALCLVVCDLLALSRDMSEPIRKAIASELGVESAAVIIASTHTHHGPSGISGSERIGWPMPEGFTEKLRTGCVSAAASARDGGRGAILHYARAPLPEGFAFNRRALPFTDPWFAVLDVRDEDGARIGTVANLSIHPVLLGPQWMSVATDWVGTFRTSLEEAIGGTAIELTGALGDINPVPYDGAVQDTYAPWATWEQTVAYANRLAAVVAQALADAEPVDGPLRLLRHETIEAPVGGTGLSALWGEPSMDVDLTEWAIGDLRLVSIPGEAFHALAKEISSARNDRVLLAGIAPWHGYIPHPWGEGYEEGVSYGEEFAAAVRKALASAP
jgi:hypothetical protein